MLKHFRSSPLWLIGLFIIFAQGTAGVAAVQIDGWPQAALVIFVISYSAVVTLVFFAFLWFKPENFYGPSEYSEISPAAFANALRGMPQETAQAVANFESNPMNEEALFSLMDNLLPEDVKQHVILLHKEGEIDISEPDEMGWTHGYEFITRTKGVSFGSFDPRKFLSKLAGTNLISLSGSRKKIFITERGRQFAEWLISHEKDAETFKSDIGSWGKDQRAIDVIKQQEEDNKPKQ